MVYVVQKCIKPTEKLDSQVPLEIAKPIAPNLAGASTFLICVESYFAALKDIVLVRADLSLSGENEAIH